MNNDIGVNALCATKMLIITVICTISGIQPAAMHTYVTCITATEAMRLWMTCVTGGTWLWFT